MELLLFMRTLCVRSFSWTSGLLRFWTDLDKYLWPEVLVSGFSSLLKVDSVSAWVTNSAVTSRYGIAELWSTWSWWHSEGWGEGVWKVFFVFTTATGLVLPFWHLQKLLVCFLSEGDGVLSNKLFPGGILFKNRKGLEGENFQQISLSYKKTSIPWGGGRHEFPIYKSTWENA